MRETTKVAWHRRVTQWKASGETAVAFAAREGIKAGTLRWWSSRFQRGATAAPGPAPVRMVQLVRVPSSSRTTGVIVDLPDARARVLIEPGFDQETLARVLELLGRGRA